MAVKRLGILAQRFFQAQKMPSRCAEAAPCSRIKGRLSAKFPRIFAATPSWREAMLKISPDDLVDAKTLADRLAARPKMMAKVVKMLDLMENAEGDLRRADEAERQVIEIMRETGHELLSGWAGNVAEVVTAEARIAAPVVGHAKKNSTGIRRTAR
jgi:hypothetical protein